MGIDQLVAKIAKGGRVQELTSGGERAMGANRIFRLWTDNTTTVLKAYGSAARERRERRALQVLRPVDGLPKVLDRGADGDLHWAIFEDAGSWSLNSLPENLSLAKRAGAILRAIHETDATEMSNLARGIDQEWVTVDFISTFKRLERYRGRLDLPADLLEEARGVRPPFASPPRIAHTNPSPDNFLVSDAGDVTLINWEWATMAPLEWDLSRALWLLSLQSGPAAANAFAEGYGADMEAAQLDRWTVYHTGMMLVYESENRIKGRLDDLGYLIAELRRAVTGAHSPV
jgi:aminoglycoside phosphotransferase (APT) family kinase protein